MPSGIGFSGRKSRPYRKHRPLPAVLLVTLLGAASLYVWFSVFEDADDINEAIRCHPPASAPPGRQYTSVGHDALDDVTPIPPSKVAVRVLNAGDLRGEAAITTAELRQLGFTQVAEPANDPAYEDRTANCEGQIRFGDNGAAAARTLSLIDTCLELINDGRKDATVDLAIGTQFTDVMPRSEAIEVLDQLSAWAKRGSGRGTSELASNSGPDIDEELLEAARPKTC
ncbi:envelope integrity protein Cei [Haloechinothrix salitolerans]|uniref:Envelope integrity protein Cei n=1 Tax=Haloechinothrix salitolerans TaxID=926830 RepID=A0ABW2C3I0_9PSEU